MGRLSPVQDMGAFVSKKGCDKRLTITVDGKRHLPTNTRCGAMDGMKL